MEEGKRPSQWEPPLEIHSETIAYEQLLVEMFWPQGIFGQCWILLTHCRWKAGMLYIFYNAQDGGPPLLANST